MWNVITCTKRGAAALTSSLFTNLMAIIKKKKKKKKRGAHLWKDTVRPSHTGCWWCIETSSRTGRSRWAETQKTKTDTQSGSKHNRFIWELVSTRRFSRAEKQSAEREKHCTCVSSLWQQYPDYCRCNGPLRFAVSLLFYVKSGQQSKEDSIGDRNTVIIIAQATVEILNSNHSERRCSHRCSLLIGNNEKKRRWHSE